MGKNARHNRRTTNRLAGTGSADTVATGPSTSAGNRRFADSVKPRILWFSNAPWAQTGYGQQTAQVVPRIKKENYSVAIHAMYGLEGSSSNWNGIKIYPRGIAPYSDDIVVAHAQDFGNGDPSAPILLLTLFDVWTFKSKSFDMLPHVASWVPIDHKPCPPEVLDWCRRDNVKPIAMSRFGESMLNLADVECLYIPHAIEKTFKPTKVYATASGEMTGRELMGVPADAFVVGMNAANKGVMPSRKAFGENFLAFSLFAKSRPDAVLYVHSDRDGMMGGVKLVPLAEACGITAEQIRFVDQYAYRAGFPQEALAAMYTGMDVLLSASMGEGFGLSVIEAQACGTPVIVSDFTAQPELVGDGWCVPCQPLWDSLQTSWFATPSVPGIVDALNEAYEDRRGPSQLAIDFAAQYGADRVFDEFWKPALKELSAWCRS